MKKFLIFLVLSLCTQMAFADGAANINIKIRNATADNRYFLCMPNLGCLSIKAAEEGKVYPVYGGVQMHPLVVENLQNFKVYTQGFPSSCNVNVADGQTLSIFGTLVPGSDNSVRIEGLHCTLQK